MRIPLRVIILPRPQRPEEGQQPDTPQKQRGRDQDRQDFHRYFNRKALSETVIDDNDIASAAARGVAAPTSAKGTAITL